MSTSAPGVTPKLRLLTVYASDRAPGMYLFVDRTRGLEPVPEALLVRFGEPREVMTLPLTGKRVLARADVEQVLASVTDQGFYLQMPPPAGTDELGLPVPAPDVRQES